MDPGDVRDHYFDRHFRYSRWCPGFVVAEFAVFYEVFLLSLSVCFGVLVPAPLLSVVEGRSLLGVASGIAFAAKPALSSWRLRFAWEAFSSFRCFLEVLNSQTWLPICVLFTIFCKPVFLASFLGCDHVSYVRLFDELRSVHLPYFLASFAKLTYSRYELRGLDVQRELPLATLFRGALPLRTELGCVSTWSYFEADWFVSVAKSFRKVFYLFEFIFRSDPVLSQFPDCSGAIFRIRLYDLCSFLYSPAAVSVAWFARRLRSSFRVLPLRPGSSFAHSEWSVLRVTVEASD